ncbi:hypothetical protein LOTGIDRAFT_118588 [Lottia gigantea]|uniref:Guanylate cyclase domain-containing protein n=1 Tax=Lottia gigantea TaxID=225164 RepID=V4AGA7_LOTGI|nr:hypothetical protein LOTGIDRAFT_118588 [Lottia gigantea]ESO94200.1 hypothetical protein LOTGIDRAFT_118588 [Lottia gigantea]
MTSSYNSAIFSDGSTEYYLKCKQVCGLKFKKKHVQLLGVLLIAMVPISTLVTQNSLTAHKAITSIEQNDVITSNAESGMLMASVIHRLQIERGMSALYIGSNYSESVKSRLEAALINSDTAIESLTPWPLFSKMADLETKSNFILYLQLFREQIWNNTITDVINFYTDINTRMLNVIADKLRMCRVADTGFSFVAYHLFLLSKEETGIERALGSTYFSKGGFNAAEYYEYNKRRIMGESYLTISQQYSDKIREKMTEYRATELSREIQLQRNSIKRNNISKASVIQGEIWFSNITDYLNFQKDVQDDLAEKVVRDITTRTSELKYQFILALVALIVPVSLSPFIIYFIYRLLTKMNDFNDCLKSKSDTERKERKRNQALLYEILPIPVARKLLKADIVDPEHFQSVTVFFSEICEFEDIVANSRPLQIIDMMNCIFRLFDSKLTNYDVYKVETVAQTYMVVSGVPNRNEKHAIEAARFSLDILEAFNTMTVPHLPKTKLDIRIGLNTGPVVAGVVGLKMPRYCLFGDTVNTASRFMTTGLGGCIQISDTTKLRLQNKNDFLIETRGNIDIKGKGLMETHWLRRAPGNTGQSTTPRSRQTFFKFQDDEEGFSVL